MKKTAVLVIASFFFGVCTISGFAWAPPGCICCKVRANSVPAGTVYLEMLVQKEELGDDYLSDSLNRLFTVPDDAEIVSYDIDGFVSYTYHCRNSGAENALQEVANGQYQTRYGIDQSLGYSTKESMKPIMRLRRIRFAYVDADGAVLNITETVRAKYRVFLRGYLYYVQVDGLSAQTFYEGGPPYWLLLAFPLVGTGLLTWGIVLRRKAKKHAYRGAGPI